MLSVIPNTAHIEQEINQTQQQANASSSDISGLFGLPQEQQIFVQQQAPNAGLTNPQLMNQAEKIANFYGQQQQSNDTGNSDTPFSSISGVNPQGVSSAYKILNFYGKTPQ